MMKSWIEESLFIKSVDSQLFGILIQPVNKNKDICFIFIASGMLHRIGPHRLYVKLARALSKYGYSSIRFDPQGLGDSSGHIEDDYLNNLYFQIQHGKFVNDTITIINYLRKNYKFNQFYLIGLCGGAVTAFLTANKHAAIKKVVSMGLDIKLSPVNKNIEEVSKSFADFVIKGYIKNFFNLQSWRNLFKGNTDFSLVKSAIISKINSIYKKDTDNQKSSLHPRLNFALYKEFEKFIKKDGRVLFLFSEYEKYWMEFKTEVLGKLLPFNNLLDERYQIKTISKANHNLALPEWQQEALETIINFLNN